MSMAVTSCKSTHAHTHTHECAIEFQKFDDAVVLTVQREKGEGGESGVCAKERMSVNIWLQCVWLILVAGRPTSVPETLLY